jgi:transcriptional regulator with XRE-family HTH domain
MNDENAILINIGKIIFNRRKELNMTQDDLAFSADIDRTYIGYIENGKQNITISVLCKIANVLKIDIKDLFNYDR